MTYDIKTITEQDILVIASLAVKIYEGSTIEEMIEEFNDSLNSNESLLISVVVNNEIIGFAESSLRYDYVEGTSTSPVGYLEGVYVLEDYRKLGLAKAMIEECERWAKSKGCSEFASDCELSNKNSELFHKAIGFEEVNKIVCFAKRL